MPLLRRIRRANLPIHGNDHTEFSRPPFRAIHFPKDRLERSNIAVVRQFFVNNCINKLISIQASEPRNWRDVIVRYFFSGDIRE